MSRACAPARRPAGVPPCRSTTDVLPIVLLPVALLLAALPTSGCTASRPAERSPSGGTASPGQAAAATALPGEAPLQDFELDTASGERVRLAELLQQQRIVLLSFWATWCEPCKLELPHLASLQQRYAGQGLTVLAISVDEPASVGGVKTYLRSHGIALTVPLDTERRVTDIYNPKMIMPYWVLLDRRGQPVRSHQGYLPGDENVLEREVRSLIGAARPPDPAGG